MTRPTLEEQRDFLTSSQVAKELGICIDTLRDWLRRGLLPPPTAMRDGLRLFAPGWLNTARAFGPRGRQGT